MQRINIILLYGGDSPEHEISLKSAFYILKNLNKKKYNIYPIAIDKKRNWYYQDLSKILDRNNIQITNEFNLNLKKNTFKSSLSGWLSNLLNIDEKSFKKNKWVVFPVLHGENGEDGSIQGLFQIINIPVIGSGVLGSAISIDKDISKKLVNLIGIPVVKYISLKKHEFKSFIKNIDLKELKFPLFVKPAKAGSSIGISKIKNINNLKSACEKAFKYGNKIIIENALNIREIEYAVIGNDDIIISSSSEIINDDEFYTYEAKYLNKSTKMIIGSVEKDLDLKIRSYIKKIFKILEIKDMARIDFFIEKETKKIYFNEINTIPGFTKISQYPVLLENLGYKPCEILDKLINI